MKQLSKKEFVKPRIKSFDVAYTAPLCTSPLGDDEDDEEDEEGGEEETILDGFSAVGRRSLWN